MRSILLLLSFLICSLAYSQDIHTYDNIYAKGGSFFRGIILDTLDHEMRIQLAKSGALVSLPLHAVKKVTQEKQGLLLLKDGLKVQGTGLYQNVSLHYIGAQSAQAYYGNRSGLGLHYSTGVFLKPWLAVGGGLGIDVYSESIVPVYAEGKVFLNSIQPVPYFSMQVGYGFLAERMFSREEWDKSKGGLMWYPALGFRFPTRRSAEVHIDFGYKFQGVTFIQDFPEAEWGYKNITDRIRYQSFSLRFGYLF